MQKYYEAHKDELKTEEKRKVDLVSLALTADQKKLAGKERIEVLQELSDRATDFTQALLEKGADFRQVAEKFHVAGGDDRRIYRNDAGPADECRPTAWCRCF